jgi:putative pyruvate formate lyase activating enzyme
MHRQVGLLKFDEQGLAKRGVLVRHLVMPGLLAETRQVLKFLVDEIGPGLYINMMDQYRPAGKVSAKKYDEIYCTVTRSEYEEAVQIARKAGFRLDGRRSMGGGLRPTFEQFWN